jgi:hypothetical protein
VVVVVVVVVTQGHCIDHGHLMRHIKNNKAQVRA